MINKIFKFIMKYWVILAALATITTSMITEGFKLKGLIDKDNDAIAELQRNQTLLYNQLNDQDEDIDNLDHRILPLETIEKLREKGLMK